MNQGCPLGAMVPPDFGRSQPRGGGGRLCPPNDTGTLRFSDLSTALCTADPSLCSYVNRGGNKGVTIADSGRVEGGGMPRITPSPPPPVLESF